MTESDPQTPPDVPGPWQPRFSMGALLMMMLIFSVMAAAGSYLMRTLQRGDRSAYLVFTLFTLAAPMMLLVIISLIRKIAMWINRRS